jgi:predicted HicB family RNase H-like nuclease
MMEHRGYHGSVHYSDDDGLFYGKVEFIRALISYEGTTAKGLRKAFEHAVDEYLDLCRRRGETPEQPFKGTFNVRVGKDLHRRAAVAARNKGVTLNRFVADVLEDATLDMSRRDR